MILTPEELQFLYHLLDKVNVSGEESKAHIVSIMRKLRLVAESKEEEDK